jgi:antitoxin HicB
LAKIHILYKIKKGDTIKTLNYRIRFCNELEGGYTVTVPSLPGCITFGDSLEEAVAMATEAIQLYLESMVSHGEEIPLKGCF